MTSEEDALIIKTQSEDSSQKGGGLMNFKIMRLRAGLTQQDVAEKLDVDRSSVAKWETGEAMPRADKLPQIAVLLNCTVDELLVDNKKDA